MLKYLGLKWYLLEMVFYYSGVILYEVCHTILPFQPIERRWSNNTFPSFEFRSVSLLVNLTFGGVPTRFSMFVFYVVYTYILWAYNKLSQPIIY